LLTQAEAKAFLAAARDVLTGLGWTSAPLPDDSGKGEPGADPQADEYRVAAALAVLPNNFDARDDWVRIGAAVYAATGGSDYGGKAFDAWSQKWTGYNAQHTEKLWRSFHASPPREIGAGTLFMYADEARPGWIDNLDAPDVDALIAAFNVVLEGGKWVEPEQSGDTEQEQQADSNKSKPEQEQGSKQDEGQAKPQNDTKQAAQRKKGISATPFTWIDPTQIPKRQWLYKPHYIRQFASLTVSTGGMGKSTLVIVETLAMVTGKPLLGVPPSQLLRVWYWNGEDPMDELQRRFAAAAKH
jgi:hypothetical protein